MSKTYSDGWSPSINRNTIMGESIVIGVELIIMLQ